MEIERIAVRLRRRNAWEALDLGHAMLRAWAGPAYRTWLASYWMAGLVLLGLFWSRQEIALLILWWLKPLFDRFLLFAFSRSLFDVPTTLRDLRGALPQLIRHSGLLSGLTLRRFSMARSFLLPVWQLENQRGKAARGRCQVLGRRTRGNAVWLTFVCVNVSMVLWFSFILVIEALRPQGAGEPFSIADWFRDDLAPGQEFLGSLIIMAAESLVEPLYVASGFALYLHRRSELEGWDIELAFRRLAHRITAAATASGLAAALVLAIGLAASPGPAQAEAPVSPAKAAITQILADPVFGHKSEELQWQQRQKDEQAPDSNPDWVRPLLRALDFAGEVFKGLVWIGALLLAAWLIYLVMLYRERWFGKATRPPPPDFLFGLDVRPESLPDDVAAAAQAALAAGQTEKALSLLYRGALVALIHRIRVEFQPGDTEGNCRERVDGRLEPAAGHYFGQLVDAWRTTAYGHQPPPLPRLESLCRDWERHFGAVEATP